MKEKQPVYWRGKIFGALTGLMLGHGAWLAVVIGFLIGHWIDKARTRIHVIRKTVYYYQTAYAQQYYQQQQQQRRTVYTQRKSSIDEAYDVLGVDSTVTDVVLKKAYRRLMSQHHPDKLMAQGASESAINIAKQKTQMISVAYEKIVRHRREVFL